MERFFAVFERPTDPRPLAFFRVLFFFGVGLHFLPPLLELEKNYGPTAVRSDEWSHGLHGVLEALPWGLVQALAVVTALGCAFAMIGLFTRVSSAVAGVGCYVFASFNALPVQTLAIVDAWAILALWPLCGGGDAVWSVDAWRRGEVKVETGLLRALVLAQVLVAVFFAGVEKLLAGWPLVNEMQVLLSYPRGFLVRDWVFERPWLHGPVPTWALTWATVVIELGAPVALLFRRTALVSFVVYQGFFLGIIAMLEVPPFFYFTFAPGAVLALGLVPRR